ncbi:MAG: 50S ribosomal protein L23 [Candidatus Moraniibacteriota bacterium]
MAEEKKDNKKGTLSPLANVVLMKPRVTEKAYAVNALNQYVFQIAPRATKTEVRRAVEEAYGVSVVSVNIVKLPEKRRVFGKVVGRRNPIKKAIVKLKTGDSIALFKAGI